MRKECIYSRLVSNYDGATDDFEFTVNWATLPYEQERTVLADMAFQFGPGFGSTSNMTEQKIWATAVTQNWAEVDRILGVTTLGGVS